MFIFLSPAIPLDSILGMAFPKSSHSERVKVQHPPKHPIGLFDILLPFQGRYTTPTDLGFQGKCRRHLQLNGWPSPGLCCCGVVWLRFRLSLAVHEGKAGLATKLTHVIAANYSC